MPADHAVVVNGANKSQLAAVVRATVVVNFDAGIEVERPDQALAIEQRVEVSPNVAVCRPGTATGNQLGSLITEVPLHRGKVLAQCGVGVEFGRLFFMTRAAVEKPEAVPQFHHAGIVRRKPVANVIEYALA